MRTIRGDCNMGWHEPPLVAHVIHSLEGGGTERVLLKLLQHFDHSALRHTVITLRHAGELASELPEEVACVALESKGRQRLTGLRLARILSPLRPAIVHARNTCTWLDATVACSLLGHSHLLLGFHGFEDPAGFCKRNRFVSRLARFSGAEFTSVSQRGARLLQESGVSPERISVISNGVRPHRCSPSDRNRVRSNLGFRARNRVFGTVGSLKSIKGHDTLIRAFAPLAHSDPDARLLIVGDGPLRAELQQLANHLHINGFVVFTGACSNVQEFLAAMDAYVCASSSEEMSNALMEAMAAGLPTISTAVGDHPLLIRDGVDGLLVPPDDTGALASAIRRLPTVDLGAMGRLAAQRMTDYAFDRTVAAYEALYRGLIEGDEGSSRHAFVGQCQKVSPRSRSLAPFVTHH